MNLLMELLRDFKKISKNDVSLAGGKGASLGEMTQAGISIPPGFIILIDAFEKFLEETDLNIEIDSILDSVNHKEIHTVENASEKIKALILRAEMPKDISVGIQKFFKDLNSKYVAVRSSATAEDSANAAWAGQLESYLNTTEETLLENVKKCWASLFTPRAIFYRFEKDLHKQKISVAVVVQKMVESEKSGIAFSVHPVTQDRNQLIIEAGFGLGEAIVSGQITPDSYVVEKQPRRIIDKNVQIQTRGLYRAEKGDNEWHDISKTQGEKQVLSDQEILELSEIILRIESHYGFPCDIEWAYQNEQFYIVQSRPITTLSDKSIIRHFQKFFTREIPLIVMEYWHKGEFDGLKRILKGATHFNPLFIKREDGLTETYYDMNNPDTALEPIFDFFKNNPKEFDQAVKEFEYLENKLKSLLDNFKFEAFGDLFNTMTEAWSYLPIWIQFGSVTDDKIQKKFIDKSFNIRDKFQELEYKIGNILVGTIKDKYPEFREYIQVISFKEALNDQIPLINKLKERQKGFIYFEGQILTGISKEKFAQKYKVKIDDNLATIGEFSLDNKIPETYNKFFTRDFSLPALEVWYRGETITPKQWTEQKQPHLPYIIFERNDDTVACYYNQKGVDWAQQLLLETAKKDKNFIGNLCQIIPKKLEFIRPLYEKPVAINHKELVRFLKELEEYYPWFEAMWWLMELTPEQLGDLDVDELREIRKQTNDLSVGTDIVIRKSCEKLFPKIKDFVHVLTTDEVINKKIPKLSELKARDSGFIYTDDKLFVGVTRDEVEDKYNIKLEKIETDSTARQIKGLSAYKGLVRGKVRRVMGHKQIFEIQDGEILVSPMTMPDFLPAMQKASAFVTDEGGITCHASIMAREMKKPCIVGTKIATQILKDGDEIEVDANNGIIRILK